jgi:hypothetical protein
MPIPTKSPLSPLFQRGEFLPLAKGGKVGFYPQGLHNSGPTIEWNGLQNQDPPESVFEDNASKTRAGINITCKKRER